LVEEGKRKVGSKRGYNNQKARKERTDLNWHKIPRNHKTPRIQTVVHKRILCYGRIKKSRLQRNHKSVPENMYNDSNGERYYEKNAMED
jgi:hypothetical protein